MASKKWFTFLLLYRRILRALMHTNTQIIIQMFVIMPIVYVDNVLCLLRRLQKYSTGTHDIIWIHEYSDMEMWGNLYGAQTQNIFFFALVWFLSYLQLYSGANYHLCCAIENVYCSGEYVTLNREKWKHSIGMSVTYITNTILNLAPFLWFQYTICAAPIMSYCEGVLPNGPVVGSFALLAGECWTCQCWYQKRPNGWLFENKFNWNDAIKPSPFSGNIWVSDWFFSQIFFSYAFYDANWSIPCAIPGLFCFFRWNFSWETLVNNLASMLPSFTFTYLDTHSDTDTAVDSVQRQYYKQKLSPEVGVVFFFQSAAIPVETFNTHNAIQLCCVSFCVDSIQYSSN